MRQAFVVAPEGLAAAVPRLHREVEVLGRCRAELARVLAEVSDVLAGLQSGGELVELTQAGAAATTALVGAVTRLEASMAGAASRYAGVEALVTAAERSMS